MVLHGNCPSWLEAVEAPRFADSCRRGTPDVVVSTIREVHTRVQVMFRHLDCGAVAARYVQVLMQADSGSGRGKCKTARLL